MAELVDHLQQWRAEGKRIVFTNGVFDILHVGHVTYLEEAAQLGDVLIVGINSDASVKRLGKGDDRPVNPEFPRAKVIGSLRCVRATTIFDADTPFDLIKTIEPDVLVKGGDYDPEETDPAKKSYIVGSDIVKKKGGSVVAIDLVNGFSTTSIIRKIKSGS